MSGCNLCPRKCSADRESSLGFCKCRKSIKVARASLHLWEEPCISGKNGAGTVFFSGCNLSCVYCQNEKISHGAFGKEISAEALRDIFLSLIDKGAHNIELVTPTHFVKQIKKALYPKLPVPVIYNCGGYESAETLKSLEGYIDIYMPDMKYSINSLSQKYSSAADYREINLAAIEEMYRQTGDCTFDESGLLKKGVLVRHLVLPNAVLNSKGVIRDFLRLSEGKKLLFSLMAQYTPTGSQRLKQYPELNRKITQKEYDSVLRFLEKFPEIEGYVQELSSAKEDFIPDFDLDGIK